MKGVYSVIGVIILFAGIGIFLIPRAGWWEAGATISVIGAALAIAGLVMTPKTS
jgi:hypothetical protein